MIFEKDAHTYRKLINNDYFITPQLMLDRIVIHNAISPAKLILQGFTQDKDGNLLFVVDQKIVRGTVPTDADIKKLTKLFGMDPNHKLWNQGVKLMKQLKLWKKFQRHYGKRKKRCNSVFLC